MHVSTVDWPWMETLLTSIMDITAHLRIISELSFLSYFDGTQKSETVDDSFWH